MTANANAENRNLLTPYRNVTGKNTTTVVRVAAKHWQRYFAPAFFRGHRGRLAQFQMPVNVLQYHHRVVDQPGKRQRQSAQHHAVDGAAANS